jgi:hypothetical protein
MSFDDSVLNDLGINDNSGEKKDGFEKFLSKPIQRQYQPFGGQMPQKVQSPVVQNPVQYEQPQPQPYQNFNDYDLDAYEQAKKQHSQISQYARENKKSASRYGDLYDNFKKKELTPFFESVGGFGDFDTDDEYISAIDEMYKTDLKNSQEEDGFFGSSDAKVAATENLKKYGSWNQPNGLRDKFLRLKSERDRRKAAADEAEAQEFDLFEQMTSIPISQREALDASLKSRTAKPKSKKATDEMLNQMQFDSPKYFAGELLNPESIDPRAKVKSSSIHTNPATQQRQRERMAAAMKGNVSGFMSRRQAVAKDRQLRDKGFMFSTNGQIDGRPIGMSRKDSDLLDLEEMKKAGMTEYKGQPIEQALESLGGEERLKVAKIMQSVYAAKSNFEDAQLEYLKDSGSQKSETLREKMEAAREEVNKTIGLAAQFGLDNELFEQAETTGWLSAIGNAVKRGLLMSEMSNYTPDFLTNTLDADEMQKFIEIASEIEKLPTSSTMKRVKSTKSDGFLDAMGNLLFDNPAAIPEMFVESLSSFLPSAIKWMLPTAATGALAGSIIPGAGTAAGAALGARASWGAASFVLEASGMALEGMQELGIDWKNPKIFAAAWTNESIRNKIQKKMVQKGTPIAVADMLTGMMAGKVMAIANHTGNAMFKGGKLLNKTQFNKTAGAVPRFTKFQKTRNAAAELGADSLMGMSGEYLGQWASKEPGEDWDWDAIAAEGIVGVGPGVLSSALEMRSRSGNYFGNAPIEITGENMTETGSMGTVTRAGYSAPYQTFNDAESMMGHLQTVEGVSPESLEFTQNWVERMYAVNPEGMSKLKIAFSPRTPDANLKNRGTFEARDGHNIMYINEKEFAADPMGAFMHESGHFARIMILSDEELRTMWGGLGEDNQLEAYTQYFTKKPDATFDSLDEKTQKKIRRAFDRTPDDVLAEEWFSYQFARVLLDNTGDKIIKKEIKAFNDKVLRPIIGEYVGTENLAGAKKGEKDYILDQKILQALGYENGMPDPKVPDEGGKPGSSTPQTKEQTQTKLNAMPGTPQEKSKIAKAVNAMLGADILTESPSAYSPLQNLNTKLAQEEAPEDPEKVADAAPAFTGEKEKETTVKIEGERPKAPAEKVPDVVENRSLNNKIGAIQRKLGKLQRQGNEGSPEKIKNRNKAIARYKKDLESLIKQGVKRGEKLVKPEDTIKKVEKRAAEKKAEEKVDLKVKIEEKEKKTFKRGEIKKENPRKANTPETIAKEETEARNKGLTKDRIDREVAYRKFVNSLLPNNKRKRDVELYKTLQANKELVSNQYKLDKRIVEIQKSLGPNASASRIISELLNLSSIARLAPESIAAKIRKAVEPDASSSKPPSSKDVEDTAAEITDRLEVIKDLLRTELDRIDKDIASLETGLAPQPAAGWQKSTAPAPAKVFAGIGSRALPPSAQKEVAKLFNQKGQSKPSKVHSGSAKGSDYLFEMLAVKAGIAVEAHTFEGHRGTAGDPANFKKHSQEELNKADSALKKANETLGRTFPAKDQHTNNLLRRNYYQVVDSDQIIAFAPLLNGLVQGGTGWAVQMAIDMGKEVHIFDTNTAQWFSWPQPAAQGQGPKKKAESPGFIEVDGEKVLTPKIEDEIAEMRRARKLVEVAIDMIAPEEATIEWKDVPHSQYWYKPKFQKGPIRRLTLGMLAENRDFNKITILDRYKKDTVGEDTRAPQEILWDWVTTDFDPNKGSETTGTKNAYYGLVTEYDIKTKKHTERPRTKSEYIMILEAVKASAMFTKKNNIGKKPMGTVRLKKNKKTGRMEEYGRGYPGGGYTTDRGATYAAVIAERIRSLMNTSAKDEKGKPVKDENGMLVPVMERAPIISTNPTLEDMIALKAANGRTLELLGDPSDSLAQFHAALFQIARDETLTERQTQIATLEEIKRIRKEFLTEEDRKKIRKPKRTFQSIASEVSDNQFEYAEDEGNPFPSVEGSKSLLASLIKIPSLSARQKFEKGYYDQIYRNLEKIDLGIELRIGYDIDVTTENAKKIEDYVNNNKLLDKAAKDEILGYKNELYISGVELEKLRSNQIELTRDLEYFIAEPQEFDSKYDQAQQSDHILKKRRDDFIKKYFKNLNRFDYGNIQEYEYLEPFIESDNPTIEKRDGKYAHDEFDASEIHTPFDVIQAFSRGRERFDTPTNRAMLTETEKTELEKEAAEVLRKMSASEFTKKYGERFKGLKREDVLRALNDPSDLGSRYSSRVVESPDASGSTLLKENELVLNQDSVKRQQSGQLFEELQTELFKENIKKGGGRQDSIFRKNRTTIQKDEMVLAKENIMENADPSSSTNVTAVDIAEFFLAGSNPVKQMKKLELLPSSEVKGETLEGLNKLKQLPGGLGEGLLVYIFPKFLESMYSRLGIKDWSPTTPKSKEPFSWQLEKGDLLFNGKPVQDFNMFIDEESRMSPEEMAVLVEPIVQAVIDARGLDIKNEYDKRQDALLQRNTLEGAETADERTDTSEMRDDSGNEEAKQVATLEIVEDEAKRQQTQADAAKQLSERPELLKKADDSLLEELLNIGNISRELRDILTDEYARRNNIKEIDNTFTPKNRTLNSDVTLTSDVNPNLAKANLLSRIAGDSELKKNFEEWLKDKKDSELAGSFMMSFVDQADPLKKVHRSLFETLKAAGMDITKGPMRSLYNMLNVHGKWHQYFGKGYDTVEQARIKFIQPIKDAMLKYGIDQGTFGNYLLARAAPSRNQHLRDKVKRLQKEAEGLTGTERQTALNDIEKIYLNKDGSVKHSGISDQAAYDQITEIEKDQNFVNFANEALDPYYNMNKESISMLRNASMIRESVELDGVQQGISEYDRMVGAMSKIDLADANSDFNFAGSKIKLSDPKYSYSPMQGFEGETEAFFDAERAWEELGKGQNSSGKGWDQPKSTFLNDGAFGRYNGTKGPNPDSVLANAINQFFDSAIRSHKNEVSQSFGEMFELMKSIAYPNREDSIESSDPELRIARGMLSKLPEEQKKKIKEEFDEIFEIDFQKTAEKNMYTLEAINDGLDNEIVAKRKKLNAEFKQDPLVFVYRRDGAPKFIKFKDTTKGTRMARSMKNLRYESLPSVLKYFNKITRFMAQMFTSMNPAFIIPNFFRDLGTAFIHLTEDDKKKLVKDVFKFKNLKWVTSIGKAELLISQGKDPMKELNITPTKKVKGQTEAQYAQAILKRGNKIEMYAYAKRNGAKIGYVRHDTVPELIRNIKKETGKSEGATKRRLKYALSYVDAANTGVENSVRMSTFWAAIKNGYTPQESATMSRNITVDFNQKGELTQAFGSLYVFFGAAVNSTHRFMTTLNRRSPAEQKLLIGGIATASFLVATFNRLLDDDEEEAVPDYDTISSYKRDTNLIMPIPAGLPGFFNDKKDTGYFSMPLPLGYNLFWSMGQVVADTFANNYGDIRGGSGVMEGANRLLESSMNAFNPVGGASIATIGTPTFVTPIIELWANKNFMGREIRYKDDQFGVPEPGHMQDPKSTPEHWNALSKGLNEFFGGNDVIKGSLSGGFGSKNPLMYDQDSDIKFDISGNQFKHVFYGYLGGPGQLLDTAFGGLFSAVNGTASIDNVGQVPIINRFVRGTTYGSHTRELYYNLRDTVKTAEKAVKDAKKISPKAYSLVNNDLRPLLSINSQLKAFEAQKNKFSRLKSKVESASNLTDAQKTQRIADIEEKELNMMVKVIKKAQSLGIS